MIGNYFSCISYGKFRQVTFFICRDTSIGDSIDIHVTKIVHLKDYERDVDVQNSTNFDISHYLKVVPEANDLLKEFCNWQKRNRLQMDNLSNINVLFQDDGIN